MKSGTKRKTSDIKIKSKQRNFNVPNPNDKQGLDLNEMYEKDKEWNRNINSNTPT